MSSACALSWDAMELKQEEIAAEKGYLKHLVAYLDESGENGTQIGYTDALTCAEAVRYMVRRKALSTRASFLALAILPALGVGLAMSDFDGNGKALVADAWAAVRAAPASMCGMVRGAR